MERPLQLIEREGGDVIPLPEQRGDDEPKPRIFVASIGDYEQYDRVHGKWLDATADLEELEAGVQAVVRTSRSGSPLWGVYEADGFYGMELDAEWQDLGFVSRLARGIEAHGRAYVRWAQLVHTNEELDQFEQRYVGCFATGADYAEHLAAELGAEEWLSGVPDDFKQYVRFDGEGFVRDLIDSGCAAAAEGPDGVHVFTM